MRYVAGSAAALLLIIACGAANAQGGEGVVDAGMEAGVKSVPMQSVDGPYPPPVEPVQHPPEQDGKAE